MPASIVAWVRRMRDGAPRHHPASAVRAIRGAIDIPADEPDAVHDAVLTLVAEVEYRNVLVPDQVISAIFTATPDITSMFPALAARAAGWGAVPLLCATEISVPGSLPRCIRVMVHAELPGQQVVEHVYLRGAAALRPDLTGSPMV
jgi:chorismate mutase